MQNDDDNASLKELLEKRERLLKEKEAVIKERNEILREQKLPIRETVVEKTEFKTSKATEGDKADKLMPGIFGQPSKSPETPGRRDFLRNLSLGITLTISSIGLVLLLSAPSIERAAYFQLVLLFEQGTIFFVNKIQNEIKSEDWASLIKQTEPQGELELKMFEPLLFWTNGNAGDPDLEYLTGLQEATTSYKAAADSLRAAAQAKDAAAARAAWEAARAAINRFARVANTRAPPTLPPLGEI